MNVYKVEISNKKNMNLKINKKLKNIKNNFFNTTICMFDVSKDEEFGEAFNWKNTQSLLKEVHRQKSTKYNFLDYQLQFIKAYQLIKLIEENIYGKIH